MHFFWDTVILETRHQQNVSILKAGRPLTSFQSQQIKRFYVSDRNQEELLIKMLPSVRSQSPMGHSLGNGEFPQSFPLPKFRLFKIIGDGT